MITVPPQMRNAGVDEMAYRKVAQQCFSRMMMARGQLNMFSQRFRLDNGVEIICTKCFAKEDVYIKLPVVEVKKIEVVEEEALSGIIMHPRSGSIRMLPYTEYVYGPYGSAPETKYLPGVAGGWRNGETELTTEYIYPLVDEDNASFLISKEDDSEELLGEFLEENGNYGNLYWWNGNEEEPIFLSWKGTPTRHFRLPNNIQIPGFSTFETSSPGMLEDTPIYTAFGTKLYQDGAILAGAPRWSWPYDPSGVGSRCLILGACQNKDTGKVYIVCQADYYKAPENVFIFSDGKRLEGSLSLKTEYLAANPSVTLLFEKALTKLGIYTVLFVDDGFIDGWRLIKDIDTGRVGLPWFSNAEGNSFVNSEGHVLDINGDISYLKTGNGVYREKSIGYTPILFSGSYDGNDLFEYRQNVLVSANLLVNFNMSTKYISTKDVYTTFDGEFGVLKEEIPELLIFGPDFYERGGANKGDWYATGGEGVYTWFYPEEGTCGMGEVSVEDECGTRASISVRMPDGYWRREPSEDWTGTGTTATIRTCISGNKQVVMGLRDQSNFTTYDCLRWNVLQRKCIMIVGGCMQDNGYPPGEIKPVCGDYIARVTNFNDGCSSYSTNVYLVTTYGQISYWTCP